VEIGSIFAHLYGSPFNQKSIRLSFVTSYSTFNDAAGKPTEGANAWCVVAGFFASVDRWEKFEIAWNELLQEYRIPYSQLSLLHARQGHFSEKRWQDADYVTSYLSAAAAIIRSCAQRWGADVVAYGDFDRACKAYPGLKKFTNPYGLCGSAIALRLQVEQREKAIRIFPNVEHFFEEGDEGIGFIGNIFKRVGMHSPIVRPGKPRSDNPSLRYYVHFQAADWLAFETRKLAFKSEVKIRESHRALLRGIPGEAKKWNYSDLLKFCEIKKKRGQMK